MIEDNNEGICKLHDPRDARQQNQPQHQRQTNANTPRARHAGKSS